MSCRIRGYGRQLLGLTTNSGANRVELGRGRPILHSLRFVSTEIQVQRKRYEVGAFRAQTSAGARKKALMMSRSAARLSALLIAVRRCDPFSNPLVYQDP